MWLPFFQSLLRKTFFLPYAYAVVFCLFVCFYFLFLLCLLCCPFLATTFFAGHFSCPFFPSVCFPCLFFSDHVPFELVWLRRPCHHGWIRSGSVNNARTTAITYVVCFSAICGGSGMEVFLVHGLSKVYIIVENRIFYLLHLLR